MVVLDVISASVDNAFEDRLNVLKKAIGISSAISQIESKLTDPCCCCTSLLLLQIPSAPLFLGAIYRMDAKARSHRSNLTCFALPLSHPVNGLLSRTPMVAIVVVK